MTSLEFDGVTHSHKTIAKSASTYKIDADLKIAVTKTDTKGCAI